MKIAILLLSAAALWGQQATQETPQDKPKAAKIEGMVVSTTGEPVPRAQVQIQGPLSFRNGQITPGNTFRANSDDAGKFAIEGIEPGSNYNLQSTKTGYVTGRYGARSANGPAVTLSLDAGESVTGLTLRMAQQGSVTGRIVDENGDPVTGVQVSLQARSYPGVTGNLQQMLSSALTGGAGQSATSDDRGEFRIAPVGAGRYYVSVSPQRNNAVTSTATAMLPTYYPSSADTRGATLLTLTPGQAITNVEVRMRKGQTFTASGKIVNESGTPGGIAQMIVLPAGMRELSELIPIILQAGTQPAKPDGTFVLRNLAAGSYQVAAIDIAAMQAFAQGQGGGIKLAVGSFTITSEDVKDLSMVMGEGPVVTGTVKVEGGELKELVPESKSTGNGVEQMLAARVSALLGAAMGSEGPLSVGLSGGAISMIVGAPAGLVAQDGTFTINGLAPGEYQMQFGTLPAGFYLKSASYGGTDAVANPLQLGTTGGRLDLVFAKNAGTVAATMANEKGEPETGVHIVLWTADPQSGLGGSVRTGATDRKGQTEFKNLRPGTYYMAAFDSIDPALAQSRDFLKLLQGDAAKLEIGAGAQVKQPLKWIPAEKIAAAEEKIQ